jgi:hypothetical protein
MKPHLNYGTQAVIPGMLKVLVGGSQSEASLGKNHETLSEK